MAQPWHGQSSLVQRACLTAQAISPRSAWDVAEKFYEHMEEFGDQEVADKGFNQLMKELFVHVREVVDIGSDEFLSRVDSPLVIKLQKVVTNYSRQNRVHVTPTYILNGLTVTNAQSSWTLDEWKPIIDEAIEFNQSTHPNVG